VLLGLDNHVHVRVNLLRQIVLQQTGLVAQLLKSSSSVK
jgi:hypothetical protein